MLVNVFQGIQHSSGHEISSGYISIKVQCPLLMDNQGIVEADPKIQLKHSIASQKYEFSMYDFADNMKVFTFVFKIIEDHKVLNKLAGMITTWDEVTTLGLWLHCDSNDVERLQSENNSIKGAAYKILRLFYQGSRSKENKAQMLNEALKKMGKQAVNSDFKLNF